MIETIDRNAFLGAMSIIDLLEVGWRPGEKDLTGALMVHGWGLLPPSKSLPYRILGLARRGSIEKTIFVATLLAIDRHLHWARIWNEWIVLEGSLTKTATFEAADIQQAGGRWLREKMQHLPAVS
jgi:hypothetical protein